MANHSFRAAYWVMCVAVALSTCMLLADPERSRSILLSQQIPPTADITLGTPVSEPPVVVPPVMAPVEEPVKAPLPMTAAIDEVDPPRSDSGLPPLPMLLEADSEPQVAEDVQSWAQTESEHQSTRPEVASVPVFTATLGGNDEPIFEELPPPPEFDSEPELATAPSVDPAFVEFIEQFSELDTQIEGLRSDVASLQESQTDVVRSLEQLAEEDAEREIPRQIEIKTWMRPVGRQGAAASWLITALLRAEALAPATTGPPTAEGIQYAWIDESPQRILRWLNQVTSSRELSMSTLRVTPTSTAELELRRQLAPRMVQARGPKIIEIAPPAVWERLEVRAFEIQPGFIEVEFALRGPDPANPEWTHIAVPQDGVLVLTIPEAHQSAATDRSSNGQPAMSDRRIATREFVVILAPRLIKDSTASESPSSREDISPRDVPGPRFELFETPSP